VTQVHEHCLVNVEYLGRIRGLVNFRTAPSSPSTCQKNRSVNRTERVGNDNYHQRGGDADHIMQIDGEHTGL
jgi:hypothetical protein